MKHFVPEKDKQASLKCDIYPKKNQNEAVHLMSGYFMEIPLDQRRNFKHSIKHHAYNKAEMFSKVHYQSEPTPNNIPHSIQVSVISRRKPYTGKVVQAVDNQKSNR